MQQNLQSHRSLSRALDVLELCGTCTSGYTLSQLSRRMQVPKSSLFPLVHTLHQRGYLTLTETTQQYRIGSMAFHVGNHYLDGDTVIGEIEAIMRQVAEKSEETCYLGSLKGGDVFYLRKIDPASPFAMIATEGHTMPAYATGIGKALLIDYTLPMLKALYYDGLYSLTDRTITSFHVLASQLARMRTEGITSEIEESTAHVRCFAVPIRKDGQVVVAMSVAMPVMRYTPEKEARVRSLLADARDRVERLIRDVDIMF